MQTKENLSQTVKDVKVEIIVLLPSYDVLTDIMIIYRGNVLKNKPYIIQ